MPPSLWSALAEFFIPRRWLKEEKSRRAHGGAPRLEALEDRCLMSAPATVPSPFNGAAATPLLLAVTALMPRNNAGIVFLGDSVTWGFAYGLGAPVWHSTWGAFGAADYGAIGLSTQNVLWQLEAGQLLGTFPSAVVLNIGTNNLCVDGDTPQETAAGVAADVQAIHAAAPQATVVVFGLTGGQTPNDPYRALVNQTNALVGQMLAGDPRAVFIDVEPAFEQPDGSASSAFLFDSIHPTALGYAVENNLLLPDLERAFLASVTTPLAF
jgi:lysophospholipase L1-like esterase